MKVWDAVAVADEIFTNKDYLPKHNLYQSEQLNGVNIEDYLTNLAAS